MDLNFALTPGEDLPCSALARIRQAGPVVWSDSLQGWVVSGAAELRAVLSDMTRFTSAGTPVAEVFKGEGMLTNDTPLHHRIRAVWAPHVSRAAMDGQMDALAALAAEAVAPILPALDAGEAVDIVPVIRAFVMQVIARSFGVPHDRLDIFTRWSQLSADTPALGYEPGSAEQQRHEAAKAAVFALIDELVADRKARRAAGEQPGDLTATMVAAEGQDGITAKVVTDNLLNFILGALDTTERWIGNILRRLGGDATAQALLRAEPDRVEAYAEEAMRVDTVAQVIQRRVREGGANLAGQHLRSGDAVYAMLGAANRDEAEFSCPASFDPDRPRKPHFGFGFGFHHCLGINIARAEAIAFVQTMLKVAPAFAVDASDYGATWALWGPRSLLLRAGQPRPR